MGKTPSSVERGKQVFILFAGDLFILLWRHVLVRVDGNCQHFGVTGSGGGLGHLLKAECLAFLCGDGEEGGCVLCLSGMNILGEQAPGRDGRAQPRAGCHFKGFLSL